MSTEFANIELSLITPSLTNPRKNFNPAKLTELAEDIKRRGIDTPITVRPLPGSRVADTDRKVQFELVCGERRYRASQQAGVATIPAMVRALTDEQALEVQLVENLQRDDLTELEEAEGYEALMQHSSLNADQVGERINKSRSYVYGRLKLLDLCSEARTSLRDRTIDASRALLVARIPDHKLQIKAMKEIVSGHGYYSSSGREPMTYRQAAEHVQSNYMLKLSDARFQITAVDLVPDAGSCKTCTKRTGHNPDLFSDVKGADVCTDPPCFHKKEEAHRALQVASAKAKGQTVIAGKAALELKPEGHGSWSDKVVGYRRLDSSEDSPTDQPLRKLIGPLMKAEGIKPVLIESGRKPGEFLECLPNEIALKLLKATEKAAVEATTTPASNAKVSKEVQKLVDEKKAKAEAKAKAAYEQEWRDQLVAHTWELMKRSDDIVTAFNTEVHRYVALKAAHSLSTDQSAKVSKLLGLDKVGSHSALLDHIKTTDQPDAIHMLMIMVHDSSANDFSYDNGVRVSNEGMHLVSGIVHGAALKSTLQDIQSEALAKHFPKVKTEKAKVATGSAARPEVGAGGQQDTATPRLRAPKPKLSAEEATQGIAAAMQGLEGASAAPKGAVASPAKPAGAPEIRYRGPNGETWTGRGLMPRWLHVLVVENGRNKAEFAVPQEPPPTVADPLLQSAIDIVVREQKANVRLLKTELKVGTTKAMELMEQLQQAGKVSACDERGARKVLVAA